MPERLIFHCDCNNFFASCECLERPELKDVPMAVAGDPENRVGIVVAKNEIAKKYGVKTTDTVWQARKKCPDIVFVPPRHRYYKEVSDRVNAVYRDYTDYVEPASIDESYLDVTGAPEFYGMTPRALADAIRERVKREIGITVSIGVSYNKIYAKMGSEKGKFDIADVINSLCQKLIYRHPHVFGDEKANSAEAVLQNWEQLKLKEKGRKPSVLSGVPKSLPALVKAYRIQDKTHSVGFDWPEREQVWAKVEEELQEFKTELQADPSSKATESEFGDLLFSLVNAARLYKINPENALDSTNLKFISRFNYLEEQIKEKVTKVKKDK